MSAANMSSLHLSNEELARLSEHAVALATAYWASLEERPVFVVEGTARTPHDIYGKRVLVVDKQAWVVLATDLFDRGGQRWKTIVNFWSAIEARLHPLAGACVDHLEARAKRWRLTGATLAEAVSADAGLTRDHFTTGALADAR